MNKEKKLTDEEIVKALECCTVDEVTDCENCPLLRESCAIIRKYALDLIHRLQGNNANQVRMRCDMQRKFDDLQTLCTEQKAEIERLTEERDMYADDLYWKAEVRKREDFITELTVENAELQKKVDELKERAKIDLENERNWGKIQTKQAVKDTAKEICDLILEHWEKKQFVECDWLRVAISERYGVEVE